MTREEAIKELKEDIELYIPLHGTIDDVDRDLPDGRLITALEMGIKALEQEPCEDVISRRAVEKITWEEPSYSDALNVLTEVRDKVRALPPVNPQPYEDAISREDALMALTGEWTEITDEIIHCFIKRIKALPPVNPQPCEDAISREATLKPYNGLNDEDTISVWLIRKNIEQQPPVTPQPKAEQFAKWVAGEIFDDMWEYNKDAFAEIACRKLAKLGIVIRMGDEWELIDPQESEEE